tara:strand:- start:1218 stop:1571 length:354 start_codon:yes stop_codon:yes gene_type:complete
MIEPRKAGLTQDDRVLAYLQQYKNLTQLEALSRLGVLRLAACVNRLRGEGWGIQTERVSVANRYGDVSSIARYHLDWDGNHWDEGLHEPKPEPSMESQLEGPRHFDALAIGSQPELL